MMEKKEGIAVYIYRMQDKRDDKSQSPLFLSRAAARYAFGEGGEGPSKEASFRVEKGLRGKPYFPEYPWLHFSISHSGDFWACAMAAQEVGLDLQQHTKGRREHISKRFFHPLENEYLKKNNYRDYFDVGAAKESYVKFTGSGIGEDFGGFSAASEDGLAKEINGIQLRSIPFSPDYSLCLCAKEIQNISLYYENA